MRRPVGETRQAIGLDVGGTKIAGAVVTGCGHITDRLAIPTPTTSDRTIVQALLDLVAELRQRNPGIEAVGVGAAGIVEWPRGYIRWAPNNSYRDLPLKDLLADATGLPTVVDNDANAAAWAEARLGLGTTYDNLAFVTVGTGLGGGLLLGGQLYRGRSGLAAELGHMIINPGGEVCGCGNRGCLEAMASGTALERLGRAAVAAHPLSRLAQLAGGDPHNLTGCCIFEAARCGDSLARSLFDKIGYWLGVGIASLTSIFELELVVIGGGLVKTGDLLLGPARASLDSFAFSPEYRPVPPIRAGTFGPDAGVVGAAHLALTSAGPRPDASTSRS
jgi:glucokinase